MTVLVGTTTAAGATDFFAAGEAAYSPYVAAASGTAVTAKVRIRASAFTTLQLGFWDNAGNLIGQTGTTADTTAGEKTLAISVPFAIVSGTTYRLGWLPLGGSLDWTNVAGAASWHMKTGQVALPNPWGTDDANSGNGLPIQLEDAGEVVAISEHDYSRFPRYKLRRT
jgi:hypothetical protein